MWILYAAGSAFFAGITSILAKCGIKQTDSNVATAIRTVVILIFAWLIVLLTGSWREIPDIDGKTMLFLCLSGAATGASWLCYFRALQVGDINKVVPVDKSSTVLTILLALIFLHEGLSAGKAAAVLVITVGILLMIEKKDSTEKKDKPAGNSGPVQKAGGRTWFLYAGGSALFASLTAILGKIGISGVESNLGTAIRTTVVLGMAWIMVFVTGKERTIRTISRKEFRYICYSGIATGASWLCYYRALNEGPASVVVPIDKLSVLVTVVFSYFVFGERLTGKETAGLVLLTAGTVVMALL